MKNGTFESEGEYDAYVQALKDLRNDMIKDLDALIEFWEERKKFTDFKN